MSAFGKKYLCTCKLRVHDCMNERSEAVLIPEVDCIWGGPDEFVDKRNMPMHGSVM
jgi:hypothetical protein